MTTCNWEGLMGYPNGLLAFRLLGGLRETYSQLPLAPLKFALKECVWEGVGSTFLRCVDKTLGLLRVTKGLVSVVSGFSRTLRLGEAPSDLIGVSYLLGLLKTSGTHSD